MDKSNAQNTFGTLKGIKILIIDDEQMNRLVIGNMIKRWGAESEIAESGPEAIEKLTGGFDIILMDLMMPGMDGYQTSQKIRNELSPPVNQIPILALTGTSDTLSKEKLDSAGINDFLCKPFKIEELHSKISEILLGSSIETSKNNSNNEQIISLDYLIESTDNNSKLIKEIVNIFLKQTPEFLLELETSSASGNWQEVKNTAHKMKPTVSYVGVSSIESIIKNIEDYSEKRSNLDEIPLLIEQLKTSCETAFIQLKEVLKRIE